MRSDYRSAEMLVQVRGIIRTFTEERAFVATAQGVQHFTVAPRAVAAVMKALVAQARVSLTIEGGLIIGVELVA